MKIPQVYVVSNQWLTEAEDYKDLSQKAPQDMSRIESGQASALLYCQYFDIIF